MWREGRECEGEGNEGREGRGGREGREGGGERMYVTATHPPCLVTYMYIYSQR